MLLDVRAEGPKGALPALPGCEDRLDPLVACRLGGRGRGSRLLSGVGQFGPSPVGERARRHSGCLREGLVLEVLVALTQLEDEAAKGIGVASALGSGLCRAGVLEKMVAHCAGDLRHHQRGGMSGAAAPLYTPFEAPYRLSKGSRVADASGKTLGRLCSELARRLRGKHKPEYTPHVDTGDYLVVINAEKIHVTGNKMQDKKYHRFTGYVGNLKTQSLGQVLDAHPERVIEIGVKGMLPKNPLGRAMYRKLKVYKGSEHPHSAQQPQALDFKA